jgi:hypothetical protein
MNTKRYGPTGFCIANPFLSAILLSFRQNVPTEPAHCHYIYTKIEQVYQYTNFLVRCFSGKRNQ